MSDTLLWHLVGLVLGGLSLGSVAIGAHALRHRFLPRWWGAPGLLADILLGLTMTLVVSLALGTIGWFQLVPLTIGFMTAGLGAWFVVSRTATTLSTRPAPVLVVEGSVVGRVIEGFAAATLVVVMAEWGLRTWWTVEHGIHSIDSIWYHLPVAARWSQDGTITPLHYLEAQPLTTFYPFNGSVFHGLGMVFLGNDLLSMFINLAWLALALLAGWCVGRPWGAGPLSLGATAVICTTPSLMATQPGGAYSDIAGIALLLSAVAVIVTAAHGDRDVSVPELTVAALAAGAALGTKFQFLVPVLALTLGVIALAPRGRRLRHTWWWGLGLVVTGSFWYIRNWAAVGNPLPAQEISLGPIHLRAAPLTSPLSTFLDYAFEPDAWPDRILPAFDSAVGWFWWLLLAALGVVMVKGLFQSRLSRLLCFVALATLLAFLVSPAIYGFGEDPVYMSVVLRYLAPGLALAGVAASVAATEAGPRWRAGVTVVLTIYLIGLQIRVDRWDELLEQQIDEVIWHPTSLAALAGAAVVLGTALLLVRAARTSRRHLVLVLAGVAVGLMVLSVPIRRHHLTHRYDEAHGILAFGVDITWGLGLRDERIATLSQFSYPLYGPDLSNHVERIGTPGRYGAFDPIETCDAWRAFLNDGAYTYVATETSPQGPEPQDSSRAARWTMDDPAATEVYRGGEVVVYRLDGPLDPDGCPSEPPTTPDVGD